MSGSGRHGDLQGRVSRALLQTASPAAERVCLRSHLLVGEGRAAGGGTGQFRHENARLPRSRENGRRHATRARIPEVRFRTVYKMVSTTPAISPTRAGVSASV